MKYLTFSASFTWCASSSHSFFQENICGIITALSHKDVVVRTATGSRFTVLVGQIRTGRVVLSRDRDTAANAVVFKAAADMQGVRDKFYRQAV